MMEEVNQDKCGEMVPYEVHNGVTSETMTSKSDVTAAESGEPEIEHTKENKVLELDNTNGDDQIVDEVGTCVWERTLFEDEAESLECDACWVDGKAEVAACVYCFDCEIYLCKPCQKWHRKLASSKGHFCMHKDEINGVVEPPPLTSDRNKDMRGARSGSGQLTDERPYDQAEVTVEGKKAVCGPCVYHGKDEPATSTCLDCLEHLCCSFTSSHLALTAHNVAHVSDMHQEQTVTQLVPVYEEKNYKEFFERATPQAPSPQYSHTRDKKFHHVDSFSIRTFDDLQYPQVTGLAFTLDNRLLVCDKNNERLKLFSEEFKPLSSLSMADLADVTVIDKITAVCTIPDKQNLVFVDIKKELQLLMCTDTTVKYWGIEYFNHELFALAIPTKDTPASVHILDTQGHVISIIYPECTLADRIGDKYPKYLAVSPSGGTVYVADIDNKVIALGLDGRVVFQNKSQEMRSINGMVTDDRNLYACLEEESCLLRVSLDGSNSSLALGHMDSLDRPCCVAIDTVNKKLIVSELHTSIVQVYEV